MHHENYVFVRYESLVMSPEKAIEPILEKLALKFEQGMLDEGNPQMTEVHQMPGWRSSELELPNQRSIGRFKSLSVAAQSDIVNSLHIVQIDPSYAGKQGLPLLSAVAISKSLGYDIPVSVSEAKPDMLKRLHSEERSYRQNCLRERRLFYERERPLVFA